VGVYPTPEEVRGSIADNHPASAPTCGPLLQRKEFTEMWVMKWAELLQIAPA